MRLGSIVGALTVVGFAGCDRTPVGPPEAPVVPAPPASALVATSVPMQAADAPAVNPVLLQARVLLQAGKLAEARALLQPLAAATDAPEELLALLGEVHTQILFSPAPAPEKAEHVVVAGDTLGKLAQQYGTTVQLIQQAHRLSSDVIRPGDRLRIWQRPFTVQVSKSANTLTVLCDGSFFKRYRVGTGEHSRTPVGQFRITTRIAQPPWWREGEMIPYGDPNNILGTHWLGLDSPGYGIHGTWDTNSIGRATTAGCIRLRNEDVAELFAMLPVGTVVNIQD